jgi:homoserine dehydrogenase
MKSGASFDEVLRRAQELGYAERNPSADVDGPDAARKIVILTAMSTGLRVDPNTIPMEGIRNIKNEDVAVAEACGCAIKLIGHMGFVEDKLSVWVAPCFVPEANPLNHIDDVFNGVLIDTDMLGQTLFYGRGAGKLPTAGAVVSDLTDIAIHPYDAATAMRWVDATPDQIAPAGAEKLSVCLIYDKSAQPTQDGTLQFVDTGDRKAVILPPMTADEIEATVAKGSALPVAQYRVLAL